MKVVALEEIPNHTRGGITLQKCNQRETFWIVTLQAKNLKKKYDFHCTHQTLTATL